MTLNRINNISMYKKGKIMGKKKKKQEIRLYFRDGKTDVIPQKFWDDYEVNGGLFVIKKDGAWVAFYQMDIIECMVVG